MCPSPSPSLFFLTPPLLLISLFFQKMCTLEYTYIWDIHKYAKWSLNSHLHIKYTEQLPIHRQSCLIFFKKFKISDFALYVVICMLQSFNKIDGQWLKVYICMHRKGSFFFCVPVYFCVWTSVFLSINHPLAALIAVHGAWDEWSPWSLCSSTCGRGYRDRTRTCKPPQFGGDECVGPEKQTKFCNIAVCPGEDL